MNSESENLKNFRQAVGLSQKEFAEKLGFKQAYISDIENGRSSLSIQSLRKLYDQFGYSPLFHLTGQGQMIIKTKYLPYDGSQNIAQEPGEIYNQKGIKKKNDFSDILLAEIEELKAKNLLLLEEISSLKNKIIKLLDDKNVINDI